MPCALTLFPPLNRCLARVCGQLNSHTHGFAQSVTTKAASSIAHGGMQSGPAIERLAASMLDPHLLLATCRDAVVRLWDVRAGLAPTALLRPFPRDPLAGAG